MNSYKVTNKELMMSEEKQEAEEDAKCTARPAARRTNQPTWA